MDEGDRKAPQTDLEPGIWAEKATKNADEKKRTTIHTVWPAGRQKVGTSPVVGNSAPTIRRLLGIETSNERPSESVTITRLMEEPRSSATFESDSIVEVAIIASPQRTSGRGALDAKRVVAIIPIVES